MIKEIVADELTVISYCTKVEIKNLSMEDLYLDAFVTFDDKVYKTKFFNRLIAMEKAGKMDGDLGKLGCRVFSFDGETDNKEPAGNTIKVSIVLPRYIKLFAAAYAAL